MYACRYVSADTHYTASDFEPRGSLSEPIRTIRAVMRVSGLLWGGSSCGRSFDPCFSKPPHVAINPQSCEPVGFGNAE